MAGKERTFPPPGTWGEQCAQRRNLNQGEKRHQQLQLQPSFLSVRDNDTAVGRVALVYAFPHCIAFLSLPNWILVKLLQHWLASVCFETESKILLPSDLRLDRSTI